MSSIGDQLTPEFLAQSSRRAARVVATARLAAVNSAFERFETGGSDALHDLRVSLRRLRSWLRGYRPELDDTLRARTRRRLRKIVHSTNAARDAEVWATWIGGQTDVPVKARAGHRYIAARLADERDRATGDASDRLRRSLPRVLNALANELSGYWLRMSIDEPMVREDNMSEATAELLRSLMRKLRRRLSRIEGAADIDEMHAARIAAKALRYLLDAIPDHPEAVTTAAQLSELQDTLGLVHDLAPLADRMLDEIASIAAADAHRAGARALGQFGDDAETVAPPGVKAGLLDLATRAQHQGEAAFQQFQQTWTDARLNVVTAVVTELADVIQRSVEQRNPL